jgi:hypothetical protein
LVRAKFVVNGIDLRPSSQAKVDDDGELVRDEHERAVYETVTLPTVRLAAVTGHEPGSTEEDAAENKSFWNATPQGRCELTITNGAAAEFFELGEAYYLDFSKA